MILEYLHKVFDPDKKKVSKVLFDIEVFYRFIKENNQTIDSWYFENEFTIKYWNYLYKYNWLTNNEYIRLQQGIMNILLFLSLLYLSNNSNNIIIHLSEIKNALVAFTPSDKKSITLYHELSRAIKMVEDKKAGVFNFNNNKEIYKSITWTLDKIILVDKRTN